jgi:hypothetical protein
VLLAAVVVLLLPAMFAKAITTRGVARMFWGVGALFGVAAVFMTASRGAMLGMALAAIGTSRDHRFTAV